MLVAGLDMGNLTTKAVLLLDGDLLAQSLIMNSEGGDIDGRRAIQAALEESFFDFENIAFLATTGSGRKSVTFSMKQRSPASCIAKGAKRLVPSARTVIDVGAETCTVVRVDDLGGLEDSLSNERCASGTGVFLETMAKLMRMPWQKMADASLEAKSVAEISSMCAIFAEQEVISHVHREPPTPMNDIIAGIHASMATRVAGLAKRMGIKPDVVFSGGVANNKGFARILEDTLATKLDIPEYPEFVSALGAALTAHDEAFRQAG